MLRDLRCCPGPINAEIAADAWWYELTPRLARSEPRCLVIRKNCMTRDPGGVVEQWLSRGRACAVRHERQRPATALACRIARLLAEDAAPLGAHFSTAGAWRCRAHGSARFLPADITGLPGAGAARGWARLTLIGPRLQSAVSASLLHASPRRRILRSRVADATVLTVPVSSVG
jgi:hypothetical protein